MRVLVVGPVSSPIVSRLVECLKRDGKEVLVACHGVMQNGSVRSLGGLRSYFSYFNFFKINRIVREFDPDIVHAHIVNHYGLMCLLQPKPLVVALWGSDIMLAPHQGGWIKRKIYQIINWLVLKRADRCHTSGFHVADEAEKQCRNTAAKTDIYYWGFPIKELSEREAKEVAQRIFDEFGLRRSGLLVFPRGLGSVYNPEMTARIINKLINVVDDPKKIVVLKGFACGSDEDYFKTLVDVNMITYIGRLLSSAELFYIYRNTDVHFSVPLSDSLGGGVVEPALLGSYPVLSRLPAYVKHAEKHSSFIIDDSDSSIDELCEKIKYGEFYNSPANIPIGFDLVAVLKNINKTYREALWHK